MAEQELMAPDATLNVRNMRNTGIADGGPMQMLGNFGRQPAFQRALPAIAMITALGLAGTAWFSLQAPGQAPIFQGLSDSDKSAVADALQASGIEYSIDSATGSVKVNEDEVQKARIMLAGQGLPKAAPGSDTMISSIPLGSSRAVEGETLRGAREADLARTIEAIDAIKSARIHLATPEPSVFVRDNMAPAASVMLTLQQGRSLSESQVRAIRHLVASSVPSLTPEQVSIVDQSGALLGQSDANGDDNNFQLQMQMEDRYRQAVNSLLAPVLGLGNYSVEVHADIDASESQSTRETYPKDDNALRSEEGNKSNAVASAITSGLGIPGATSNQPPPASQVSASPSESQTTPANAQATTAGDGQSAETYSRNFDVGREISVTHKPRGRLARLSVAVALRNLKGAKPKPASEVTALETLVKGAVGFDAERGDIVAISSRLFVEQPEVVTNWWDQSWVMPLARQIGAIFMALLVLLFVGRPLIKLMRNRAEAAKVREEELSQQLLAVTNTNSNANLADGVTLAMIEAAPSYEARASLVRNFVRQDLERAALVVRQLMQESSNGR